MGYLSNEFNFSGTQGVPPASGTPQAVSTGTTISSNVYDALVAKKLFAGSTGRGPKLSIDIPASGVTLGTNPTFQAQLVGADNAALTTNPIVLGQIGPTRVLTAADFPAASGLHFELQVGEQLDAKRFYGISYVVGGTAVTFGVNANLVETAQSSGLPSGGANV